MLFHAGFSTFGGGYVGVDVFFVISGYLITSIIAEERAAGRFSMVRFYERRARRILPALFVVMAACMPFAWAWMLPIELADLGRSLVAVIFFSSNFLFWRTSGYFDLAAESKPLLHTWSLGVEEQFYLILPIVIMLGWRLGAKRLAIGLGIAAVVSLSASLWLIDRDALAAFFLLPARAWELLAGSSLALLTSPNLAQMVPTRISNLFGLSGLTAILVAVFGFDAETRFPGVAAMVPVAGTMLILAFATPGTLAGRLLALPALVGLGTISYSAYLWHQPLFAFARLMRPDRPPAWLFGLLLLAALALAQLSFRFVEAPFRDRTRVSKRGIFGFAIGGSLLIAAVGSALVAARGVPQRFDAAVLPLLSNGISIEGCPPVDEWLYICRFGDPDAAKGIVLLGDSHSYALRPALDAALRRRHLRGYAVHTACHPIPGLFDSREGATPTRVGFCAEANRRMMAFSGRPDIVASMIAIRWTLRLYPLGDTIDAPAFDNGEGGVEADAPFRRNLTVNAAGQLGDSPAPKAAALSTYLTALAAQRPLVVMYPVPEVGWTPQRINLLAIARGEAPPATISTSATRYRERNAAAIKLLDGIVARELYRTDPTRILCYKQGLARCIVQADGTLYYSDDDHLAYSAAALVVDDALRRLGH
jgi:peptidoglycan/LPS O-acetylase OafA/YrhL